MRREPATRSPRHFFKGILQLGLTICILVFVVGSIVGRVKGCMSCVGLGRTNQPKLQVRPLDENNAEDQRLLLSLKEISRAAGAPTEKLRVAIVDGDIVNAASFGEARFLLLGGLKRLPSSALDAVLAHEVAHDLHKHGKKTVR